MIDKLGVILVNFNSWRDTVACLASLRELDYPSFEVFVVDNASSDGSCEEISAAAPGVKLIRSPENLGFAGGCNAGMRAAVADGCEYLWLLNNDTEVSQDAAQVLVEVARARPDYHFFGCLISFFDRPDLLWFGGGTFDRWTGAAKHVGYSQPVASYVTDGPVETDWITGCSLMIRAASLPTIGWLDEDYFLYAEDVEWQLRSERGKPRGLLVARSLVRHKVGRSTGSSDGFLGRAFMSRNCVKMAIRHSGLRLPSWLAWWGFWYCIVPALRGRWSVLRAGVTGALSQSIGGAELARRWKERIRR